MRTISHAIAMSALLLLGTAQSGRLTAEPLVPHPAAASSPAGRWNARLGGFGESLVRESLRANGEQVFDLNVGQHGIDGLVKSTGPTGQVTYRVIEVKTVQAGADFRLGETKDGRQLSPRWIEARLGTAAKSHRVDEAREAAAEALKHFRKNPSSVPAEVHGVSIWENRYVVMRVDSATGAFEGKGTSREVHGMLEALSKGARSETVRKSAARHLTDYPLLREAAKPPQVVRGGEFAKELSKVTRIDEKQVGKALKEASEHIRMPGQSRWVKVGGKSFKFIGKAAGPAGVVIMAVVYTSEAADIEQKVESGERTRTEADAEHVKLAARTATGLGGGLIGAHYGAAVGTFICPVLGTVAGGIVGGVAGGVVGCVGAEMMMAATGLTDKLGECLAPGVDSARQACRWIKAAGISVTVATREQLREWIDSETYTEVADAIDSAATWVGDKVKGAGTAVRDGAVVLKDKAVEGAEQVSEAVSKTAVVLRDKAVEGAEQAGTAIKDTAVSLKDKTVEVGSDVGEAVSGAATWTWGRARSCWTYLRQKFD